MKKMLLPLMILGAFLTTSVQADDTAFIDVSGSGEIQVMPDYLELSITITATEPDVAAAKNKVDEAFDFLNTTAKASGMCSSFSSATASVGMSSPQFCS